MVFPDNRHKNCFFRPGGASRVDQLIPGRQILLKLAAILLFLQFTGCAAVQDFSANLKYNIQGEYYLHEGKYRQGLELFEELSKTDPQNGEVNYYYGRFLMAKGKKGKAQTYLKKAVDLNSEEPDYHFWLGVAQGENGKLTSERKSYEKSLHLDPKNPRTLTYLGNNLLRAKKYSLAFGYYQKALLINRYNPQALYNRALVLKKLGRTPEEKLAWLQYLNAYPAGSFARKAADRLNWLGDDSFRNHTLGLRTITLMKIEFEPFTAELGWESKSSLDVLGETVANMPKGKLNVVVYQKKNRELAKKRALSIRSYLATEFPELDQNKRIRLSWFDVAEKRKMKKKRLQFDESVVFFLAEI